MTDLKFGAFVPQGWRMDLAGVTDPEDQYETLTRCAQEAEAAGYDSVWVYDHFHTVPVPSQQPTFEAWTAMAGLARDTRRVRLGQMVTCSPYRNPALLAKMASSVDVMSHGRLTLGIGAGWYEHEFRAYGFEFGDMPGRLRMLRDDVQIIRAMWTQAEATHEGRVHSVRGAINMPKPLQAGGPPLWIGGGGMQVTLRLVARFGDACNFSGDADTVAARLAALQRHCREVGRDYDEITRSTNMQLIFGTPGELDATVRKLAGQTGLGEAEIRAHYMVATHEQVAEAIRERQRQGFQYIVFFLADMAEGGVIRRFWNEVLSRLD